MEENNTLKNYQNDLENLERYIEEFSIFLPLPICTVSPLGIIIDVNQAARDFTGYSDGEVIGEDLEFLFKDKKLAKSFFDQIIKNGLIKNQELILVDKYKKDISVSVSGATRKDVEENIIGCFLAISDITEIKKFQENLEEKVKERTYELETAKKALINMLEDAEEARKRIEEEESKTRATLISLTDGLIVFNKDRKITLVNPEAESALGLKENQILNREIGNISEFPNLTELYRVLGKKIEWTGQKYELVFEKPIKRYSQVSIAPVVVDKETIGLMVIMHDITREREIERLKTEFVSIAAHQLRTPLSAVKWTLKMLLDGDIGPLTSEQIEFLMKGYQSNERMIILINDLLNVARIEEGRIIYELTSCSIEKIIQETINNLLNITKNKKIKLVFNKPKKSLPKIEIDKEKISIVIQNLIDNAIRFSNPNNIVTVSISCDKINIEVIVEDNGIGIPKEQQRRIFNKFFRADNAIKFETEGSGLGLFIAKNIIEAHKGKISFKSKKGKGTIFKFTLPVK